ncbi:MAG: DHH family phosphoesterase [Flavobacteriales bacterium]|nr:DHH family phosphoesterase [Flavobacteriales bacterium]|tara:strand:- start:3481 stop:4470 length:990 start_codon:yes stop_codon:yes gene_type:complete
MEFRELQSILNNKARVVIVTHKNPDGDAMGSSLGLAGVLKKKGCEVKVIAPTEYPTFLNWIKGNEDVLIWGNHNTLIKKNISQAELIFCLDFNALHRIDEVGDLVFDAEGKKVMIDHHQQPDDFVDYMISNTSASSTAEMVYEFVESMGDEDLIDGDIGEALYCGVMTDTGSFRFPSTTQKTHKIISQIIAKGADHSMVHRRIYDSNTQRRLKLLGYCLMNMEVLDKHKVAILKISKEDHKTFNIQKGDTEGVVNYGLSMSHVKCSVFFREDDGIVKISFRSKDNYDVNEFARKHFNGGGHINAAGGMSKNSLEETVQKFKKIILSQDD